MHYPTTSVILLGPVSQSQSSGLSRWHFNLGFLLSLCQGLITTETELNQPVSLGRIFIKPSLYYTLTQNNLVIQALNCCFAFTSLLFDCSLFSLSCCSSQKRGGSLLKVSEQSPKCPLQSHLHAYRAHTVSPANVSTVPHLVTSPMHCVHVYSLYHMICCCQAERKLSIFPYRPIFFQTVGNMWLYWEVSV